MCGIAGISGTELMENEAARDLIARMLGVIEHRGPDDKGHYIEPGVAMGMRRLAIIDLATGRQPISNEDGSVWIVFNGEIYNYRELRELLLARGHKLRTRTDTETIAHLTKTKVSDASNGCAGCSPSPSGIGASAGSSWRATASAKSPCITPWRAGRWSSARRSNRSCNIPASNARSTCKRYPIFSRSATCLIRRRPSPASANCRPVTR